ncbi:MAG: cell division protein SepF [Eubacteriales bacterium]|nr:cell division protein SepF [Eubacteriales bacterium]
MSVFDKLLDAIKLNDDYDEEDFLDDDLLDEVEDDDFLDDEEDKPKKKFFQKFNKKRDDEDDEDDLDLDDEPVKPAPKVTSRTAAASVSKTPVKQEKTVRPASSSKITPMRSSRRTTQAANMEVCVIRPTSMEDNREITDTLLDNSTVILNLEGIDVELAQRIIDFCSGACYAIDGTLRKISSYIFVLAPSNVDITGDLQNILESSMPSVRAGY